MKQYWIILFGAMFIFTSCITLKSKEDEQYIFYVPKKPVEKHPYGGGYGGYNNGGNNSGGSYGNNNGGNNSGNNNSGSGSGYNQNNTNGNDFDSNNANKRVVGKDSIVIRTEEVKLIKGEDQSKSAYRFYVVAGSYSLTENARAQKESLSKRGFFPVILENKTGFFRVSVNNTNNENDARNMIRDIRINYPEYSNVWLLENR